MTAERAHECRLQGVCMRSGRLSACASMLSACVTRGAEMAGALDLARRRAETSEAQKTKKRPCCECDREKKPRQFAGPRFHAPSASVGHACAPHAHRELIVLVRLPLEGRVSRRHTASLDGSRCCVAASKAAIIANAWPCHTRPLSLGDLCRREAVLPPLL
jgi:hypothetical protein